jgi:glycosyltransferase involved in cell wall biosynthesis
MDVAFFSDSYVPIRDGVANLIHALARRLQSLGHSVRVFTPNSERGAATERDEVDGVPVVRVRSVPVPLYGEYQWGLFPFKELYGEHLRTTADVLHLHTPGSVGSTAFLAARHYDKPLVGTFHTNIWQVQESFPSTLPLRLFFSVARWYTLGLYLRCDAATATTLHARSVLLAASRKPFRRSVQVIPNGIEVDRFHPGISVPDWRARCGLPPDPIVTYFGRLTADKGIHRFLDAVTSVSAHSPFSAIVGGVGPEEQAVRERLRSEPLLASRVRYVGPVAEEEKASLLSQSDLFVLPSTSDTSSIALLEAMASGAGCIASDRGGLKDLVADRVTGRLVPLEAPGALTRAIEELLDDPQTRQRIRSAGIEYIRKSASIDATARRFISLYELILSERRHDAARVTG